MKNIKNKKTIIILLVLCIGLIGITIAYFSNSTILDNLFSTKPYGTTYTETFVSPNNWLPGDTTDKTIIVTNSGSVDEAVRISLTESWKSNNGTTLSGLIDENGLLTDIEENSEKAAIINFSNTDDWTYNNGYYYYNYRLKPNETTSSFIESVTFNPKVTLGDTCTETESNGKKTITCNSSGDDYDNATYKLTLTIETVQYNKYKEAWGIEYSILNKKGLICYQSQTVFYNGEEYYVMNESDYSKDYVTLLKREPLTASEVNRYSTNYVSQDGEYPYYQSDTCNGNNQSGCSTNYDTSDVKKILDGWSSSFSNDLLEVDGYKVRLINNNELIDDLEFESYYSSPDYGYRVSINTPDWSYIEGKKNWSMTISNDDNNNVYGVSNILSIEKVFNKLYIRPMINLKKDAIDKGCLSGYKSFDIGEIILYNNENYCVINKSHVNQDYVTLIKQEPLTYDVLVTYNNGYEINKYVYSDIGTMKYDNYYPNYATSYIKNVVDNWSNIFSDDLKEINNYKARLITVDELLSLNFEKEYVPTKFLLYYKGSIDDCIYSQYTYWIDNAYNVGPNSGYATIEPKPKDFYAVRPVINLKKCAITNTCE